MELGLFGTIEKAFTEGGFMMWVIFAAQVLSFAIIAERVKALFLDRETNQNKLVGLFEEDILKGDLEKAAMKAATLRGQTPIQTVVKEGVKAALNMGGREEIQCKIDEVLFDEQNKLNNRIEFLSMLGNVGTLLGLLGTIVGMIRSFASLANADQLTKANILSAGISEAMHATAYGLIMAIPTLVAYAVLQNRANKLNEDLTQGAIRVYNLLGFHFEAVPSKKKTTKSAAQ